MIYDITKLDINIIKNKECTQILKFKKHNNRK